MTTTPPNDESPESPPEDGRELAASSEAPDLPSLPADGGTPPRDSSEPRRLFRSRDDEWIGGVSGGLAEYFEADPTLIRVAMVILAIITSGVAVIAYLVAWIIIPEAPRVAVAPGTEAAAATARAEARRAARRRSSATGAIVWGLILISIGAIFLLRQLDLNVDWPAWEVVLAGALILVGLLIAVEARRGMNGGLLTFAIILTVLLSLSTITRVNLNVDGAFGDSTFQPVQASQVNRTYSHVFGSLTVDLRNLQIPEGETVTVEVSVVFGEARVLLPADIPTRISGSTAFGSISGPNVGADGIVASRDYEPPDWSTADRRIDLKLSTVFGSGRVTQ